MQLPRQAIIEFKEAWRRSFDEDLTDEQAAMEAERLLTLHVMFAEMQMRKSERNSCDMMNQFNHWENP